MKIQNILIIFSIILILSFGLATTTVSTPTLKPTYTSDHNYMNFPIDMNATATGTDLNASSICWYMVSTGGGQFEATWLSDENKCRINGYTSEGTDDFNFSMIVQNNVGDTNYTSGTAYYYLDDTAPTTVGTFNGVNVITLTATDAATTQEQEAELKEFIIL